MIDLAGAVKLGGLWSNTVAYNTHYGLGIGTALDVGEDRPYHGYTKQRPAVVELLS